MFTRLYGVRYQNTLLLYVQPSEYHFRRYLRLSNLCLLRIQVFCYTMLPPVETSQTAHTTTECHIINTKSFTGVCLITNLFNKYLVYKKILEIFCFLFPTSDISKLLWPLLYTPTNTCGVKILWWGFWMRFEFSFTIFIHDYRNKRSFLNFKIIPSSKF